MDNIEQQINKMLVLCLSTQYKCQQEIDTFLQQVSPTERSSIALLAAEQKNIQLLTLIFPSLIAVNEHSLFQWAVVHKQHSITKLFDPPNLPSSFFNFYDLILAIENKNYGLANFLYSEFSSVDSLKIFKLAAQYGHVDLIDKMYQQFEIKICMEALHLAVKNKNLECFELLWNECPLNLADKDSVACLSIECDDQQIIDFLLDHHDCSSVYQIALKNLEPRLQKKIDAFISLYQKKKITESLLLEPRVQLNSSKRKI